MSVCPWAPPAPTRVLNSPWSCSEIRLKNLVGRLKLTQNLQGSTNSPTKMASQLRGRVSIEEGSKIENKLAIIFNLSRMIELIQVFLIYF